jgi:hypothetical protein
MDNLNPTETKTPGGVEIDYDHIDVTAIMDRIQKKAAEAPTAESAPPPSSGEGSPSAEEREALLRSLWESGPPAAPEPEIEPAGLKNKVKRLLLKLMRPFFPVIRFFGLPLHQDIRATQKILHETNKRLDHIYALFHLREIRVEHRFQAIENNAEAASERQHKAELRLDLLEARIKDLDKSMEYIRLLHTLDHNLVVELTKLKIELDTLKSKFRILEKDQDYLQKRERAIEEKALK